MQQKAWRAATALAAIAGVCALAPAARAADPIERFTAFAVDMGGSVSRPGARAGTVDIAIDRWSTPDERATLRAALQEGGTEGLLKALRKVEPPAGSIRSGSSLGYPLRFAHQIPLPGGGRRILIATDRPVSFLELRDRPVTVEEYPFMVVDVRLDAKGEGEGKLLPVAKIQVHPDNVVDIENYLAQPVRLTKVKKTD